MTPLIVAYCLGKVTEKNMLRYNISKDNHKEDTDF